MDNNRAYAYKLDENYTSIYVNLNGYEQIIFYWSIVDECEKRKPKWRTSKDTIEEGMKIISYNNFGCIVEVNGRRANFEWTVYNDPSNNPAHKGKLTNFSDWAVEYDPDYKDNSPTSLGNHYTGNYNGYYGEPREYDSDLEA
jgi:endonuclease I